jgi:hypothetical protein
MLKALGKGLLARLLAYGVFGLGFWLLFQAFWRPSVMLGVLGGVLIPLGMYLMVTARRASPLPTTLNPTEDKEEGPVDSFSGSR